MASNCLSTSWLNAISFRQKVVALEDLCAKLSGLSRKERGGGERSSESRTCRIGNLKRGGSELRIQNSAFFQGGRIFSKRRSF